MVCWLGNSFSYRRILVKFCRKVACAWPKVEEMKFRWRSGVFCGFRIIIQDSSTWHLVLKKLKVSVIQPLYRHKDLVHITVVVRVLHSHLTSRVSSSPNLSSITPPRHSSIPNSKLSYFSNPTLHRHLAPLRTDFTDTQTALRLFFCFSFFF